MPTLAGFMSTDRPDRYAKQLTSHWSERGPVSNDDGRVVQRWETGQTLNLSSVDGGLQIEVSVPAGADVDEFADVVARHLERFGHKDELQVVWSRDADPG